VNWIWIPPHLAVAWHEQLIARFGGAEGLRDAGLLESALDRPKNHAAYQPEADVFSLAALYDIGVAKAHAFVDGNKRIGFAVMVAFLKVHGQALDVSEAEATRVMIDVAASMTREDELAAWLMSHCRTE
jgi:death-on-curing protein